MKFNDTYNEEPLEKGGTSITGKVAPPVVWLFDRGYIKPGQVVLDYGAGKVARNADWLRKEGIKVWAYDPFNFNGEEGWELGSVSKNLPDDDIFDVAFSCYVFNILPKKEELSIIDRCRFLSDKQFHIVRNIDLIKMVTLALNREDKYVYKFFIEKYRGDPNDLSEEAIERFCRFGTQTVRGFQRLTDVDGMLLKSSEGFKIYSS